MNSRRHFVSDALAAAFALPASRKSLPVAINSPVPTEIKSLNGAWFFRTDPEDIGEKQNWHSENITPDNWTIVTVPHTWQVEPQLAAYRGVAWYAVEFDSIKNPELRTTRIEFEAVFHTASVWVNGKFAGEHARKGYTAFIFDISHLLVSDGVNRMAVRVDNGFNEHMLPRGRSSDWACDGGIYRPVQLLITPQVFVERIDVDALPDETEETASLRVVAFVRNTSGAAQNVTLTYRTIDNATGLAVLNQQFAEPLNVSSNSQTQAHASATLSQPKLWHFDSPHLYRLEVISQSEAGSHICSTTFGIRRFEVNGTAFYLNGEKVKLMGVERMAGSNPEMGMAETSEWIQHDHDDLKHLNCVFTRVHWPQDKRVLEYCDRHGILIQTEVPSWGPATFKGMGEQPDQDIMQNGIEQLHEMVARDRNHPCIGSWGLCNEINGQNPPAYNFAKNMLAEAKRIDPNRLCSYASHSLFSTPAKDVSGLMDFVSCNEYFGSWSAGGPADLAQKLDDIHAAFPNKPIVISEYGYCACTTDRPEGDAHRAMILRTHDELLRSRPYIASLIFFCYNDYRTHVGDRGSGVMQQRVHGVVDLFGSRKGSYELLRDESSPIETLKAEGNARALVVTVISREQVPMHTLRHYKLRGVLYGQGQIPVERREAMLPELKPGASAQVTFTFEETSPERIEIDVLRPTGFSARSLVWKV